MIKKFIVEIAYENDNANNMDIIYDLALETGIETFLDGYVKTKSIKNDFKVTVEEV